MELKHTNLNSEIVLARDLNLVKHFLGKIVKLEFRNESYKLFFQDIRCFFRPSKDYEFPDYGNALGTFGTLPHKQSDVVERLPHQIILIYYFLQLIIKYLKNNF